MMATDEKLKQCVECIKADDVAGALLKLTNGVELDAGRAARCLIELQLLISSKVYVGKASLSSSSCDVYTVADYLCSLLKNYNYEYDVNKLLTCLYYVIRYLLDINEMSYTKDMCVFLLDLKNKNGNESNVLCNQIFKSLYGAFCKSLCNVDIESLLEVEEDDEDNADCAVPVIRYLMELWRCSLDLRENSGDIFLADLIAVFFVIIPKFETLNKCVIGFIYGPQCLGYFFNKVRAVGYQNVVDADTTFVNLVKLFSNSVLSIVKFDRVCEMNSILKCIKLSKKLYRNDDNKNDYLSFYENFIGLVSCLSLPHVNSKGRHVIDSRMLKELIVSFEKILKNENEDIFKIIYAFVVRTLQKLIIPSKENEKIELLLNSLKKDSLYCLFDFFFCVYDVAVSERDNINSYTLLMIMAYFVKNCVGLDGGHQDSLEYCERTHRSLLSLLERVCVQTDPTLSLSNHYLVNIVNRCLMLHVSYVRLKLYDKCIRLSEAFFQLLISFPRHVLDDLLKAKCSFYNGLGVYCSCCIELNRPLDGLRLLLIWNMVTNDCGNRLMEMWVTIKSSRRCPPDVAVLNGDEIAAEMSSNEEVRAKWNIGKHACNAQFLYNEIQAYHNKKNLQDVPLMKAFTSLQLLSSDTNLIAKASMYLLVSLSRNENAFKLSEPITAAMNAILGKLTKKKKKTIEEELLYANLFHYSTRCNIYHARSIVEDELMVHADIKDEALRRDPVTGTFVDPLDCCEQPMVVDSAILLTSEESMIKQLDQFMEMIKHTVLNRWQEIGDGDGDLMTISLNNINTTGLLYRLYGDHRSAADVWRLLYKVSRHRYPLIAIRGFIHLMSTGVSCFAINDFLDEARSAIDRSDDGGHDLEDFIYNYFNLSVLNLNENQLKDIYQMMLISLAMYHLHDGKTADCFRMLMKVDRYSLNNLMYVNYLCTMSEYFFARDSTDCMSDDDDKNDRSKTVNSLLDEAMTYVRHFIKETMWDNFDDQCLLHIMLLWFAAKGANYFCAIGRPQDALRCIKDEIDIAQKLVLPVKTCELLINRSWIDLYSGKLYDCEFKLAHIEVILGLKKERTVVGADDPDDCGSPIIHLSARRRNGMPPHSQSQHLFHTADTVSKACTSLSGMCVFVDLVLLKSALALSRHTKLQTQICSVSRCFHYAEQMVNEVERRSEGDQLSGNWLSARRVLFYFHLAIHSQSIDCYDKCHAIYNTTHIPSGMIPISQSDLHVRCVSLRQKLLHTTFTGTWRQKQKKQQSRRVVALSSSGGTAADVSTPPPSRSTPVSVFHSRRIVYKTPSSDLNDEKKLALAASSSPGDVPHGFSRVCKQLVMDNIDGKEVKENADSPVILTKRNKNKPTVSLVSKIPDIRNKSRKPCASVDLNVNALAKNLSKFNIYSDTDTAATGPKKRTLRSSTTKPKKK